MNTVWKSGLLFLALTLAGTQSASAQDNNYWTNQFGTRSNLMSGAVVGGVRDPSAGYYNPGAVPFITDTGITVNANAYKVESTTLDNAAGTGEDLDSNQIVIVPLLIGGTVTFDEYPDHYLGWSILTRNSTSFKGSLRNDVITDVVHSPLFPGDEDFIGQVLANNDLQEYWGGLTYGYKIDDSWAVGFTNFLALRNQEIDANVSARAINRETMFVAATDTANTVDFYNLRLLWKLGVAGNLGDWKVGFAYTTPSVSLGGNGTSYRDLTIINGDIDENGTLESIVASDRQDDLDAEWRSPMSFAAGVEYAATCSTNIGVAAEYFLSKDHYSVMNPEPRDFVRPTGAFPGLTSDNFLKVAYESDSVFNVGAGIEQVLTEKLTGYLSFRTDFSAFKEPPADFDGFQPGISTWDIYHVTLGGIYKRERSSFGLGVTYSWGSTDDYSQLANFSTASEKTLLLGTREKTDADYNAISLMLGYSYNF